jgi:hypothetical protein
VLEIRQPTGAVGKTGQILSPGDMTIAPSGDMPNRWQAVALGGVAAPVGRHEVLDSVIGVSRPRDDVVQVPARTQRPGAVKAPPVVQVP